MPNKPFFTPNTKTKARRTGEAVDVAARYFVYELYDARGRGRCCATMETCRQLWRGRLSADGLSSGTTGKVGPRCAARRLLTRGGAWRAEAFSEPWDRR